MDLLYLTIEEASRRLASREISSVELTKAALQRADEVDDTICSFITRTPELALEQAADADRRLAEGDAGSLTGIPVALKDVLSTARIRTTCGSRILEDLVPLYDAFVVRRLQEAGAVLVGKTNCDEFAMGSSTENSAFFPTRNPWDTDRVPGGSSGGSATAVAAGEATFALGSDTGGSIRQPAALSGVVGMKPTYGRVSRYGLVAFASSLDQIGPFTLSVTDCATVLQAISGHDERDATSVSIDVPDFKAELEAGVRGLKVGVPREYFPEDMEPAVREAVATAINVLVAEGVAVDWEVSLPSTPYALATYYIIAPSEASANLARYDGVKYGYSYQDGDSMWENMEQTRGRGFGTEVKRRIMLGTYALSSGYYDAYYLKAQQVRTLIRAEFDEAFKSYDVLIAPTTPTTAFPIGAKTDDPYAMYLNDVCTLPVNIAGLPGISVPCGLVDGLPVGLQIIGKPFDEATVLRVARAYERAAGLGILRPPLRAAA
ncbi:MAG TPA: Asp-tRNA(Asn)/Glu-tRNA(Gln) amidotransferase subunit GatA [Dehalococcoidia bacterium]|nr:Asp-tRNA(Asn)/Glu-tRNA(Gln) amidotransferase subunit GatA [Dehalococcoidia bacterium]